MRRLHQRSITTQICMVIIGLVTGIVLLCWFLNTTFLEQYYSKMKTTQLVHGYDTVNRAAKQGKLKNDEFDVQLDRLCAGSNIELLIISADGTVIRSTSNDSLNLINRFMDVLFGAKTDKGRREVASTDSYSVLRMTDHRMSSEYLVLWGTLEDGNLIMMRTALESIRESVDIANRFLAYIGICGVLLSAVIGVVVTQRITRPVRQLTNLSRQMSELDFTAKKSDGTPKYESGIFKIKKDLAVIPEFTGGNGSIGMISNLTATDTTKTTGTVTEASARDVTVTGTEKTLMDSSDSPKFTSQKFIANAKANSIYAFVISENELGDDGENRGMSFTFWDKT